MQRVEVGEDVALVRALAAPAEERRFHLPIGERRLLVGAGDLLLLAAALSVAVSAMRGSTEVVGVGDAPLVWLLSLLAIWLVVAPAFDLYDTARLAHPVPSAVGAAQAGLTTGAIYFLTPYVSAPLLNSRAVMLVFVLAVVGLLAAWRITVALALGRFVALRSVLVVGAGGPAQTIARAISESGDGFRLVGLVDDRAEARQPGEDPMVLGGRADLGRLIEGRGVTDVVVSEPSRMHGDLVKAVMRAYESGVYVHPMASLYEQLTGRIPVEHVGDDWTGALPQIERLAGLGALVKRLFDLTVGTVGFACLLLLSPIVGLAIRMDSPGPVFYSQERVGYRGRVFRVWKFRSMVEGAEADGRAVWARPSDPRVTRVGRFLRRTRLDELPQVLNVLRGEMSAVGPRPERPEFVAELERTIPFYRARLLVKPGLTGWAQIKYRYGASAGEALVKLQYDLYYVKHRSLLLDALIVAKTAPVILRLAGR
jgi:exopolysaccharide biosynthesis polyprenyl glycosylphosphotransferase